MTRSPLGSPPRTASTPTRCRPLAPGPWSAPASACVGLLRPASLPARLGAAGVPPLVRLGLAACQLAWARLAPRAWSGPASACLGLPAALDRLAPRPWLLPTRPSPQPPPARTAGTEKYQNITQNRKRGEKYKWKKYTTKKAQNIKIQPQKIPEDVTTKNITKYKNTTTKNTRGCDHTKKTQKKTRIYHKKYQRM